MFLVFLQGTGKDEPSVSDKVTAITVVKSDGNEKNISDEETLKAARVNLATFGVMVEIKMNVVTMPNAKVETRFHSVQFSFNTTYMNLQYDNNFSLELFWYPYNSIPLSNMLTSNGKLFTQDWNPEEDEIVLRKIKIREWYVLYVHRSYTTHHKYVHGVDLTLHLLLVYVNVSCYLAKNMYNVARLLQSAAWLQHQDTVQTHIFMTDVGFCH